MAEQERGVSPVISTILMVAIVVILSATISVFVLGLGESISDNSPAASFDTEQRGNPVILTHVGGDTIQTANLNVRGAATWGTSNKELTAGDRITVIPDSGVEKVVVTWTQKDTSTILTSINIDGSNLIINPTFVAGSGTNATFWEQDDTAGGAVRTSDRALVGDYSIRQDKFISSYSREFISEPVDVSAGEQYEFGGSYYLEATSDNPTDYDYYVTVRWLDSKGNRLSKDPPDTEGGSAFQTFNEWTETEINAAPYTAPQNAEQAELRIRSRDNGNKDTDVYWDNIFLKKTEN